MSRIAVAYLNVPLAQLENFAAVRGVFARNTRMVLDNALRFTRPTPEVLHLDAMSKLAADALAAFDDPTKFAAAETDFVALVHDLQKAMLEQRTVGAISKASEIAALASVSHA